MDKRILIGGGILLLAVLGFLLVSNMTGNVITGMSVVEEVENEYFLAGEIEEIDKGGDYGCTCDKCRSG
jgi:hypothetical protein